MSNHLFKVLLIVLVLVTVFYGLDHDHCHGFDHNNCLGQRLVMKKIIGVVVVGLKKPGYVGELRT